MTVKVSVVMSVFNAEKYLSRAVESVLSQSFQDFEFIVIDDGSTDGSHTLLRKYEKIDSRIKLISRENKGLIASLNEGIATAKGEYIMRMDADDVAHLERMSRLLNHLEKTKHVLVGSWACVIDYQDKKVGVYQYPPQSDNDIRLFALKHNPFIHPSVMFRREVFLSVGGYRPFFRKCEDYELWTRIIFTHKTSNLPEELLYYRVHSEQVTKKYSPEMKLRSLIVRVLAVIRFITR